jgi:RNA polymerase sigma-70 factor (ECF subfamily)
VDEAELLLLARGGDELAFGELVGGYRKELSAHCYRMLGSLHDAEDALQESLLSAWRGIATFEGRSSLRTWLYRICTNACIRLGSQRPKKLLTTDQFPSREQTADLGEPVLEPMWLEPCPDDPAASYLQREGVELAFVAALQHLPSTQRAVLILREVLEYSAAEVAEILDTTPQSVNSALQRARKAVEERVPPVSQQAEFAALGEERLKELVEAFLKAWELADVDAIAELLAEDVRFSMPPLPAWFDGRAAVLRFISERIFETPWRLVPIRANGQPAFAGYRQDPADQVFRLAGVNLLQFRDGRITWISSFLDPATGRQFAVPETLSAGTD